MNLTVSENTGLESLKEKTVRIEYDKNLILYGPPGTGKTYNTAIYAVAICTGKSIAEVAREPYSNIMDIYNRLKKENRIAFVTFHQSYGYEEFIEGIKPVVDKEESKLEYTIESGIFKKFCVSTQRTVPDKKRLEELWMLFWKKSYDGLVELESKEHPASPYTVDIEENEKYKVHILSILYNRYVTLTFETFCSFIFEGVYFEASLNPQNVIQADICNAIYNWMVENLGLEPIVEKFDSRPKVLIIDEINRGNISKIFGELITLIEDTKRKGMPEAASALLPYSRETFSVPRNIYILGTMNTADRSIALIDTALRRRFRFVEMMPNSKVLRDIGADKVEDLDVAEMLDIINERIILLYDREHTIGHTFFTKLASTPTVECLQSIFEKSVIPLLQEYFYEDYQKIQLILGDNEKSNPAYKFILDEEVKVKSIFKGNAEDIVDFPEKKYIINEKAFGILDSYKEII